MKKLLYSKVMTNSYFRFFSTVFVLAASSAMFMGCGNYPSYADAANSGAKEGVAIAAATLVVSAVIGGVSYLGKCLFGW